MEEELRKLFIEDLVERVTSMPEARMDQAKALFNDLCTWVDWGDTAKRERAEQLMRLLYPQHRCGVHSHECGGEGDRFGFLAGE